MVSAILVHIPEKQLNKEVITLVFLTSILYE